VRISWLGCTVCRAATIGPLCRSRAGAARPSWTLAAGAHMPMHEWQDRHCGSCAPEGAPCTSAPPGRRHRLDAPVAHALRALAVRLCAEAPATWPCANGSLRPSVSCQATLARAPSLLCGVRRYSNRLPAECTALDDASACGVRSNCQAAPQKQTRTPVVWVCRSAAAATSRPASSSGCKARFASWTREGAPNENPTAVLGAPQRLV